MKPKKLVLRHNPDGSGWTLYCYPEAPKCWLPFYSVSFSSFEDAWLELCGSVATCSFVDRYGRGVVLQ